MKLFGKKLAPSPSTQNNRTRLNLLVALGLVGLISAGIWLPLPDPLRLSIAALLLFFLPGWLWLQAAHLTAIDKLEQLVLSVGLSYALVVLASLSGLYLVGYSSATWVVGIVNFSSLIFFLIALRHRTKTFLSPLTYLDLLYFLAPITVAIFFSFTNLAYADYWGDEMNGLLRAISTIAGRFEAIFEHTKGPVEILIPAVFGLLIGHFDPFTVRVPFALLYIASVASFYILACRLFGRNVGLVAALLLAINGLYLTFGRMVQYQAFVFLMINVSILLAYNFYRGGGGITLWLSSICVGAGLLAHYDALMALPPLVYLVWRRCGWQWTNWRKINLWLLAAVVTFAVIGGAFYIPFLLHPHIAATSNYLSRVINPTEWPSNNFDELYQFTIMANSAYYVAFIFVLGLIQIGIDLVRLWQERHKSFIFWLIPGATLAATLLALATGWISLIPLLIFGLLFTILIGFYPAITELKTIYVWMGVPFVVYIFFIDHPRNHIQNIFPGWVLLAALASKHLVITLQRNLSRLPARWITVGTAGIFCLFLVIFSIYQYLLYIDTDLEYIFTYPKFKQPLYWEDPAFPFGSRRLHGAPHRLGWQMVNQLFAQKTLQGDWSSNDSGSNLFWYTLGAPLNPCYPRYYFLTQFEQKDSNSNDTFVLPLADYEKIGEVWNRERLQIEVYEFAPLVPPHEITIWAEPTRYATLITPGDFYTWPYVAPAPTITHQLPTPTTFQPAPAALQQIAVSYGDPRIEQVVDKIELVGYDIDDSRAKPAGLIVITLYWRTVEPIKLPYKVFTHLETTGEAAQLVAQADDFPNCGTAPTPRWQVGEIIPDRHVIKLPADLSFDEYTIRIGLYEPQTNLRLDWLDALENPQGVSFDLVRLNLPAIGQ